jgi:hypothetical protein
VGKDRQGGGTQESSRDLGFSADAGQVEYVDAGRFANFKLGDYPAQEGPFHLHVFLPPYFYIANRVLQVFHIETEYAVLDILAVVAEKAVSAIAAGIDFKAALQFRGLITV